MSSGNKKEETERQRQEINAFAAMANGDFGGDSSASNKGTFDFSKAIRADSESDGDTPNKASTNDEISSFAAMARGESSPADVDREEERASFAKAAQQQNSGTFSRFDTGPTNKNSFGNNPLRESNLEAAALALDKEDRPSALHNSRRVSSTASIMQHAAGFPGIAASNSFGNFANGIFHPAGNQAKNIKMPLKTPMHTQKVTLHRPLFFGPNLPPRVIREAKAIVSDAVAEQLAELRQQAQQFGSEDSQPSLAPRIGQLAPSVRNLISAIQCYGYGVDILPSSLSENGVGDDEKKEEATANITYRGSPYLSVYCPKWSALELQKPGLLSSRSVTDGTNFTSNASTSDGNASCDDDQQWLAAATAAGFVRDDSSSSLNDSFRAIARASGFTETVSNGATPAAESSQEHPGPSMGAGQPTSSHSFLATAGEEKEDDDDDGLVVSKKNNTMATAANTASSVDSNSQMSERDMFSLFARGGSAGNLLSDDDNSNSGLVSPRTAKRASLSLEHAMQDDGTDGDGAESTSKTKLSDKELFTKWVQQSPANAGSNSNVTGTVNFTESVRETAGSNRFFQASSNMIGAVFSDDSDDDSVVGSEMKKKVGVNEHLNAALASLEEHNANEEGGGADDTAEMAQVPLTEDGGRPLSNHELMDGHAPLFGIDDPPLPSEADLGNHETREEQQRSKEQRRTQTIIEKCCPQNIFGPLACPNPATSPDDNLSWNSMSTPLQRHFESSNSRIKSNGSVSSKNTNARPQPDDGSVSTAVSAKSGKSSLPFHELLKTKVYDPRSRFGWWNKSDDDEVEDEVKKTATKEGDAGADDDGEPVDPPIQLPPWEHASNVPLVRTPLEPKPETLHEQNRPLSELHPATSLARAMPYLSDRPPSYRHLQVDTQNVSFPALGGEAEALFCSVAIYHVETVAQSVSDRGMAPIPDLQRCGKVTETLNFDVVNDPSVEKRCQSSLCPYPVSDKSKVSQGTRCGVFPLPSNLSVHNLYVIITVSKVISEGCDFEPYLRPKSSGSEKYDLAMLRCRAEIAAKNHGKFLMPFAFGVAPLLQVFGTDIPRMPSSRAVQIPLFRFNAGSGERQIIDHIMVMLYPRADHKGSGVGGPAPVTNGGIAMLVMRSFGYLGLHEVVDSKSSLARDRLVDFTGEMQLRRRNTEETTLDKYNCDLNLSASNEDIPQWKPDYVTEATEYGGRFIHSRCDSSEKNSLGESCSDVYAQELAPLPLLSAPLGRPSGVSMLPKLRGRGHSGEDIEPYFHTTFCNEIVCTPRLLHNCPKGNIVVKVEMRELEWNQEYSAFFAHLPSCGPALHNPRRGAFLIQGAYTSCSARCANPHFLDEFKMKLPLILEKNGNRPYCIFFTAYRLSFSSRKKWSRRLMSNKRSGRKIDEIAGELAGESTEVSDESKNCHLIQLGCGFLSVEKQQALVENGNHDVRISFAARKALPSFCREKNLSLDTLIVSEITDGRNESGVSDDNMTEDGESQGSGRYFLDTVSAASFSERDAFSETTDDGKLKSRRLSPMLLQVRVSVQSSLHSQNSTLNEFFSQEPDLSVGSGMEALLSLSKEDVLLGLNNTSLSMAQSEHHQYEANRLMISTVDIAKSDLCSVSDVSAHLLRVVKQLWKITVVGTGNLDLEWANPAATIPLRVNAFATLLQILGSSTLFFSKRGTTQLDGKNKWNFVTLSRILGLVFDEEDIFALHGEETITEELLQKFSELHGKSKGTKRSKRQHVRSNFEFLNNGAVGGGSEGISAVHEGEIQDPIMEREKSFGGLRGTTRAELESSSSPIYALERRDRLNSNDKTPKPDSVADFRSALNAGLQDGVYDDEIHEGLHTTGNTTADSWIKAFGGSSGGAKRWMTAPSPGLATIREDVGDDEELDTIEENTSTKQIGPLDQLSSEILQQPKKTPVRQFRVPKRTAKPSSDDGIKEKEDVGNDSKDPFPPSGEELSIDLVPPKLLPVETPDKDKNTDIKADVKRRGQTLPTTDADMIRAGSSFLDAIEKSLGLSAFAQNGEEEERVYGRHHRKKLSHSSIDWSIPNDDLSNLMSDKKQITQDEPIEKFDESMGMLQQEMKMSMPLPSFYDRLAAVGNTEKKSGRWFPFVYEVVILQWVAILLEQQALMEPNKINRSRDQTSDRGEALADAASRTSGAIIACAPVLFEVIKQSLGARVHVLYARLYQRSGFRFPPLVTLDDTMMANLEQLIAIITDACLDSRNFDSWETRQNCVDVNDAIVCFLRDMFAFLDPACVYRLTMLYWSRLVARDGRQWADRDSNIGLRVSWEITKLQMNAISAFVRFQDFVRINSPQMNNWTDWWTKAPALSTVNFFDDVIDRYEKLGLPSILSDSTSQDRMELPRMRPHWLTEIVVDICLAGIEHAEQNIQRRSSSLLLEMFWSQALQGQREGYTPVLASMYITFIEKVISRTTYLAFFSPKSQVRQDVILCIVFVLQSAPQGLLRALWRKLFSRSAGKGSNEKYGGTVPKVFDLCNESETEIKGARLESEAKAGPDIYDMFGLLNVCLATVEYEGCDEHAEIDGRSENDGPIGFWRKEFLLTRGRDTADGARRRRLMISYGRMSQENKEAFGDKNYETTSSRKWLSHDASIVLIRTAQQIVRELRFVLEPAEGSQSLFNPARRKAQVDKSQIYRSSISSIDTGDTHGDDTDIKFSYNDTIIFVRGATSVYLNSLVLRQSDIALVKTLNAAVEIIKIFGIKIFNDAVGETLQHWLRMITFHCGSRRAEVRVPASDFMELILRSTWDCFGSFFRIRIPLLAVQTEVMERIVATAIARHYRDQRKMGNGIDLFSNASAEASLTPLWRTTDRLHHQSASQNVAFRSSLVRLAEKLKKLHRAYIAAHALSFQSRSRSRQQIIGGELVSPEQTSIESQTLIRANRISVIRVVNASAAYSKQFLGLHGASQEHATLAHHEAVEDAFLEAADVFSPTELPDHRVAWLRKLAQFHATRNKSAEEATCHYMIYYTLNRSSRLSGSLWSSTPFLPWIDNMSDGIHLEGPAGDPDDGSEFEIPELDYGRQIDKTNSFRRIFYRNENSIRLNAGELEAGAKTAFFGVALTSEYLTTTPWITLKEMEANMLEEAEAAGDLFKKSGVIASSRYMWSLAAQYFAEKYMYGKLAHVYERLARTIVAQVPTIDSTLQQEVSVGIPIGRFYRVWFHGGAPDELIGAEFVYRTATNITLSKFGKELRDVIRCIIPENTPIHLVLDGRPEESVNHSAGGGFSRMGGAPLEPVRVKVTPLRPVVENAIRIRGLPEWFKLYIDTSFTGQKNRILAANENSQQSKPGEIHPGHHHHTRSYSTYHSNSGNLTQASNSRNGYSGNDHRQFRFDPSLEGQLIGADKFWFMQPINKERSRGSRDWLKSASTGDFAEKTLRVTQLQVGQSFPACVSRQTVVHRVVFTQSPLEAAYDIMCQWCAVLFRTSIASNGIAVLGMSSDPGIGIDAAKVVSECMHSSRVKEMGVALLQKNTSVEEEDDDVMQSYDRLSEDEVSKYQLKLARSLVVFMELLHVLISRNRDLLLDVIQTRKKAEAGGAQHGRDYSLGSFAPFSNNKSRLNNADISVPGTLGTSDNRSRYGDRDREQQRLGSFAADSTTSSRDGSREDPPSSRRKTSNAEDYSVSMHSRTKSGVTLSEDYSGNTIVSLKDPATERVRTDSAIGIQRELQLAFISLAKDLYPMVHGIMERDTPRWLKECCKDNYFSAYKYREAKIAIGEELTFEDINLSSIGNEEGVFGSDGRYSGIMRFSAPTGAEKLGLIPSASRSDRSLSHPSVQAPTSPGGSVGSSSIISRGSDTGRSTRSTTSGRSLSELKKPIDRLASC